ncbi:MAG TPA: c-type cytochrome domain-containing protein, partial [Desulfuromonadaceae bacterium]|nr:c-type cytochrome domain-containing protein [Desulfuromonadaceae bacterium]
GELRLDTKAGAFKGGEKGEVIVAGKPDKSPLYTSTILPRDHDDVMPPKKEGPLTKAQSELLRSWIEQGAAWPENVTLNAVRKIDFVKDIKPILEVSCVSCHLEGHAKGKLRLDKKAEAFKGGENGQAIVPGKPEKSLLYTSTTLPPDHDDLMPPKKKGGPLSKDEIDLLRLWIEQGASWPDDETLIARKAESATADEVPIVAEIHKKILDNLKVASEAEMKPYTDTISGTKVTFDLVPIPNGEFLMGSPPTEAGRKPDEGPRTK